MIHHSIGSQPDHQVYNKLSQHIRYSAAELATATDPTAEIDRVLRDCVIQKQPVYIFLPIDKTDDPVPKSRLSEPLDLAPPVNAANEEAAIKAITEALYAAKKPALFIDYFANRYGATETQTLIDKLGIPVFAAHMGKGAFNEDDEKYVGMYNGAITAPGIAEAMEYCDFILSVGWFPIDTNSSFFSRQIAESKRVDIMPDHVLVCASSQFHEATIVNGTQALGKRHDNVYMAPTLRRLADTIDSSKLAQYPTPKAGQQPKIGDEDSKTIKQSWLWSRMGSLIRPGDTVLADTGTATYGFPDVRFPRSVKYIAQSYWMSIGYTCPAAFGADIALEELYEEGKRDRRGRTLLFIGDGSLMLTLQEVATMMQKKLPIVM